MLSAEVVTDLSRAEAIRLEWSALADACDARAPSYPWWCLPWWRRAGRGRLLIVVVREDSRLIGLAPFHLVPIGPGAVVRMLGHATGSVSRILVIPGYEEVVGPAVWDAVLSRRGRVMQLLQYEIRDVDAIRSLSAPHALDRSEICPTVDSTRPAPAVEAKRLARILRRAESALARDGTSFRPTVVTTRDGVSETLSAMVGLVSAAEEARPRGDLFSGAQGEFTVELLGEAADAGRLRLHLGWVGERLAVFHAGLLGRRSVGLWGHRTDPSMRDYSPGHLNIRAALDSSRREGIEEVDLFPGDDAYKQLWADGSYQTFTVLAARSHPALAGERLGLAAMRHLRAARHGA